MAYRVRILPTAEKDVEEIVAYLLKHSAQAAATFADKYRGQLQLLSSGVVDYGLSHIKELAERGYHSCRVNSYVLLYFYEDDEIVIAHVFHQRQDYARLVEPTAGFSVVEDGRAEG